MRVHHGIVDGQEIHPTVQSRRRRRIDHTGLVDGFTSHGEASLGNGNNAIVLHSPWCQRHGGDGRITNPTNIHILTSEAGVPRVMRHDSDLETSRHDGLPIHRTNCSIVMDFGRSQEHHATRMSCIGRRGDRGLRLHGNIPDFAIHGTDHRSKGIHGGACHRERREKELLVFVVRDATP